MEANVRLEHGPVGPAASRKTRGLTGNLNAVDLTMTVLAASAPLSVMAAFAPVSLLVGNGLGMVQSYLIAGVAIILFAFGFLAMGRAIAQKGGDAGALYTYVTKGLGKPIGLRRRIFWRFSPTPCFRAARMACLANHCVSSWASASVLQVLHGGNIH